MENYELMKSLRAEGMTLVMNKASLLQKMINLFIFLLFFLLFQFLGGEGPKGDSFTTKLVTKIIDNLQVYINKVHIRYEDERKGQVH